MVLKFTHRQSNPLQEDVWVPNGIKIVNSLRIPGGGFCSGPHISGDTGQNANMLISGHMVVL